MLHDIFNPVAVIAGYNYTYGKDAKGDADTLIMAGERYGFRVQVIQPVISDGEPVSATRIRECIESGHVERAAKLLGYSYALTGKVGTGRRIGTNKLGFPTANLISPPEKIIPLRGVYGVTVNAEGSEYKGVCNIGVNPTVSNGARETIETHIIGMSDDLYDKIITINFEKRIRGEKKFSSIHELKTQIQRDIDSL
jgi:riboflavin kinase/FMN adenylyltransferase